MEETRAKDGRRKYERPAIRYERSVEALAVSCSGPTLKNGGHKDAEGNPCVGTPFS